MDLNSIRFGDSLDKEIFSDIACKWAKKIAGEGHDKTTDGENKPSQLRRFYDEFVLLHDRVIFEDAANFAEIEPFLHMIKAKVAYAQGRKLVSKTYEEMIGAVINATNSKETLKHAKLFLEAFMGFYKQSGPTG